MSAEKPLEGEINIDVANRVLSKIEECLNRGVRGEHFALKDCHTMYECCCALTEMVKQCDLLQKKIRILTRQQELIKESEGVQPIAPQ